MNQGSGHSNPHYQPAHLTQACCKVDIFLNVMSMYGKKPLQYCKVISLQVIKIDEKIN